MRRACKLRKILHPHPVLLAALVTATTLGLIFVFVRNLEHSVIAYVLYPISAYTFLLITLRTINALSRLRRTLHAHPFIRKWGADPDFRTWLSIRVSLCVTLLYSLFKAAAGILWRSPWFGSIAAYYAILGILRFMLLRKKRIGADSARSIYRPCGFMLLALTMILGVMNFHTIRHGSTIQYPGFMIYAAAAYAFCNVTAAILRLLHRKKSDNPILQASRILSLSTALVSIFFLQASLLAAFGDGAPWQDCMNLITGSCVYFTILAVAMNMIRASRR